MSQISQIPQQLLKDLPRCTGGHAPQRVGCLKTELIPGFLFGAQQQVRKYFIDLVK